MSSENTSKPAWLQGLLQADLAAAQPTEFRLYYDDQGHPLFYSMEDLPGRYINIDAAAFAEGRYDVKIVDGKIKKPSKQPYGKIKPSDSGTACHDTNAMIVAEKSTSFWKLDNYES